MDIYNHNASVSIISIGKSPNVTDHFPMAAWKQKAITAAIMTGVTIISAGAGFGISLAISSAAQVVGWAIGVGIGAIGGTLDAAIYSSDNQDYSQFAERVKDGVVTGIRAASFGMAIGSYMNYYHRLAEKIRIQNYFDKHGRIAPPDDPSAKSLMDLDYETTFI